MTKTEDRKEFKKLIARIKKCMATNKVLDDDLEMYDPYMGDRQQIRALLSECREALSGLSEEDSVDGSNASEETDDVKSANTLLDISKALRTQDNRCTVDPMFCLQIKVRDVGYDPQYATGDTVWIDMKNGDYDEVEPDTEGAEEFGFKDRWETVMVAFTEQGILDYMKQDGHNVKQRAHNGETRIYVESFRRCDEMVRIRQWLLSNAHTLAEDRLADSQQREVVDRSEGKCKPA